MTHKILKSVAAQLPDFEKAVAQHAAELTLCREREMIVAEEAKNPLGPKPVWGNFSGHADPAAAFSRAFQEWEAQVLKRHAIIPRPLAHPEIEASVKQDGDKFVPDYEIINDDPTPDQILRAKKNALINRIGQAEHEAIEAIQLPPGKRRLALMLEHDIGKSDAQLATTLQADAAKNNVANFDVAAEVEKRRDAQHTQHLRDQESRRARIDAIQRASAQAMSDVEDLTADAIDAFGIPSFAR